MDGVTNIIASVLYLISITLICMKSPKRRNLDQHYIKRAGTFDTDEDLRASDSIAPHFMSQDSSDIEAHPSEYTIKDKDGLADEIELYRLPTRNAPSYDLNHVLLEDAHRLNVNPHYSFQSTNFDLITSLGDKITPLKGTKTSKIKRPSQKSDKIEKDSFKESDAFDELATRQTDLFSPINLKKTSSSYNFEIIDQSLETLMSAVGKKKKTEVNNSLRAERLS
jgi:hypothetical protein